MALWCGGPTLSSPEESSSLPYLDSCRSQRLHLSQRWNSFGSLRTTYLAFRRLGRTTVRVGIQCQTTSTDHHIRIHLGTRTRPCSCFAVPTTAIFHQSGLYIWLRLRRRQRRSIQIRQHTFRRSHYDIRSFHRLCRGPGWLFMMLE